MTFKSDVKRGLSGILVAVLTLVSLGQPWVDAAASDLWSDRKAKVPAGRSSTPEVHAPPPAPKRDLPFPLDPKDGFVRQRYWPGQAEAAAWRQGSETIPFVVHVQDAHGREDAQRSLARILRSIAEREPGPLLVAVEGAWGEIDTEAFRTFPDKKIRDRVADELLRTARLTGEEHLAITSDGLRLTLVGADDPSLHAANLDARRRVESVAPLAEARLSELARRWEIAAAPLLSGPMRELWAAQRAYEADAGTLRVYARNLQRALGAQAALCPALGDYLAVSDWEKGADPETFRRDLEAILLGLDPDRRGRLKGVAAVMRSRGASGRADVLDDVLEAARSAGAPARAIDRLRAHRNYLRSVAALDAERLNADLEKAQRLAVDRWINAQPENRRPAAAGAAALRRWLESARRGWRLEMTPAERRVWGGLRRRYGWADVREALEGSAAPWDAVWDEIARSEAALDDYYRLAEDRNAAMVANTLRAARAAGVDRAILIAGGFHTPGLTAALREAGASHVVLCPVFDAAAGPEPRPVADVGTLRERSRLIRPEERSAIFRSFLDAGGAAVRAKEPNPTVIDWVQSLSPSDRRSVERANRTVQAPSAEAADNASAGDVSSRPKRRSSSVRWIRRSLPWLLAGAVVLGAAYLLMPVAFSLRGSEAILDVAAIHWAGAVAAVYPAGSRRLGLWGLGGRRRLPPSPDAEDARARSWETLVDAAIAAETARDAAAGGTDGAAKLATRRNFEESVERVRRYARGVMAASDEEAAGLYLRLSPARREALARWAGGAILGRMVHGMTGWFFDSTLTNLRQRCAHLTHLDFVLESIRSTGADSTKLQKAAKMFPALVQSDDLIREGVQIILGTPYFPNTTGEDAQEIKAALRDKLVRMSEARLDLQALGDYLKQGAPDFTSRGPLLVEAALRRSKTLLQESELDLLAFAHPYATREPEQSSRQSQAVLHSLRNREIRILQRVMSGSRLALEDIGTVYRAADRLVERLGDAVQDLSRTAQQEMDHRQAPRPSMEDFPEARAALDRVQAALERTAPLVTASLIVTSDRQKQPMLRALGHRFRSDPTLRQRKVLSVDLMKVFADPDRNRIVYETLTEEPDGTPGLFPLAAQTGDVILALDLDAFEFEEIAVLDRVLEYWAGMTRRGLAPPPLIVVASEPTQQIYLRKSRAYREYFEATPAIQSEDVDRALLAADAAALSDRMGVALPSDVVDVAYRDVRQRTPYDRPSMALRVLEAAAAMERQRPDAKGASPALNRATLDSAIDGLPTLENLPLDARLWSRRDVLPPEVAEEADREIRRHGALKGSPEQPRVAEFLSNVIRFPWRERAPDLIPGAKTLSPVDLDAARRSVLDGVAASLNKSHSGLEEAKAEMMQYVVQLLQRETGEGKRVGWNLLLVGPPGVGKTTLVRAFSRALQDRKFQMIPLGGMDDEAELAGHRRTYIGARMGKLAQALIDLGILNPIIGLDEIDKLGARNGDPRAFLLQALDPEQNRDFRDRYLGPAPLDGVIFIATSNSLNIPGPLLDRFTVIHVPGYSVDEKVDIGARHVLPRIRAEIPLGEEVVVPNAPALVRAVARGYTWEEGARRLVKILRKVMLRGLREWFDRGATVTVDVEALERYLGKPFEFPAMPAESRVGEAAVPTARGQVRFFRAGVDAGATDPGLSFNQTWGPATANSARLAGSVVARVVGRAAERLGATHDASAPLPAIRLDAPGGVGEDDSVKGLGFVVAMISRRLGLPVRRDSVFLGEIDLRGRVLDVPDVRRRAIAAREAGARYLFLPSAAEASLFQEAFKSAPYLSGPVLNLDERRLRLHTRTVGGRAGPRERAALEAWNRGLKRLRDAPPSGVVVRPGAGPEEFDLSGSAESLRAALNGLPVLGGQLIYVLVEDPLEAAQGGLVSAAGYFPPPDTPALSWESEIAAEQIRAAEPNEASRPASAASVLGAPAAPMEAVHRLAHWTYSFEGEPTDAGPLFDKFWENEELLFEIIDRAMLQDTPNARQWLDEFIRALIDRHPIEMADFFNGICISDDTADIRNYFFKQMPPSLVSALLVNYRVGLRRSIRLTAQKKAAQFEEYERLLCQELPRSIVDSDLRNKIIVQLKSLTQLARSEIESIISSGGQAAPLETLELLERGIGTLEKSTADKALPLLEELSPDIIAVTSNLKVRQYDLAYPEMSQDQSTLDQLIEVHVNRLIADTTRSDMSDLLRDEDGSNRIAAVWKTYLSSLSLSDQIERGRLARHSESPGEVSSSPAFADTFEEATGFVVDLLDRYVYRAVNIVCPSDSTKAVFPGMLAERLKIANKTRRVLTIELNQFPLDERDALREILSILRSAHDAGDAIVVIDLDQFRARFGETRVRSLSRVLGRWASHQNPLPIVFLSSEEANADFTENLPVFFRWIPQHRLRVTDAQVLLDYEIDALGRSGVKVDPAARLWIDVKLRRSEIDFALAALLLRDSAATAHRLRRSVSLEDLDAAWAGMQSGELAARVRMLPEAPRRRAMLLLAQMNNASEGSPEYGNRRDVLENLVRFPWLKRTPSALPKLSTELSPREAVDRYREAGRSILAAARARLDESHYGMHDAKEEILDFLAEQLQRERFGLRGTGKILCLVGPAGVGKSTLAESVAEAMNRKFGRISLGGTRDPADIRGHSPTYQGAMPGNIVQTLQTLGVKNPVILLDEIEKMATGLQGNPADVLLQALDEEQNANFTDHNIGEVDLSEVLFIATANEESEIPEALKDRMEVVRLPAYDRAEKITIGVEKLLPRVLRDLGVRSDQIVVPDAERLMTLLVDGYTREPGVRELGKQLNRLLKRALTDVYMSGGNVVHLTPESVQGYMGLPRVRGERRAAVEVGEAMGLVVSPRGGGTINIQAEIRPGTRPGAPLEIVNHGQLQPDMLFSIETAVSYARKSAARWGAAAEAFDGQRLLVNISPGDVKKDGPSAGIGFAATILSVLTGKPLRQDVASTGQIDDEGTVYPIGGLKEKILAAVNERVAGIVIPAGNKEELLKSVFVQSPDLRGVIEENGVQRVTVERKQTLAGQPVSPADEAAWSALSELVTGKAHELGLIVESDRPGVLHLAGTPEQMSAFRRSPEIERNMSFPLVYHVVSNMEQALGTLFAADSSSVAVENDPPRSDGGGSIVGALLTTGLLGIGGALLSPDASAATSALSIGPTALGWAIPSIAVAAASGAVLNRLARRGASSARRAFQRTLGSVARVILNGHDRVRGVWTAPRAAERIERAGALGWTRRFSERIDWLSTENVQPRSSVLPAAAQWLPLLDSLDLDSPRDVVKTLGPDLRRFEDVIPSESRSDVDQFVEDWLRDGDADDASLDRAIASVERLRHEDRVPAAMDSNPDEAETVLGRLSVMFRVLRAHRKGGVSWIERLRRGWSASDVVGTNERDGIGIALRRVQNAARWLLEKGSARVYLREALDLTAPDERARANGARLQRNSSPVLGDSDPLGLSLGVPSPSSSGPLTAERRWVSRALTGPAALGPDAEALVLDAALFEGAGSDQAMDALRRVVDRKKSSGAIVAVVSETLDKAKIENILKHRGPLGPPVLVLGRDELEFDGVLLRRFDSSVIDLESLKRSLAKRAGGGRGDALRLSVWAAAGRADRFSGDIARLLDVGSAVLLSGEAARTFGRTLTQLFGEAEAARITKTLSTDGGLTYRLPARSSLLMDTINALETDRLVQTNA